MLTTAVTVRRNDGTVGVALLALSRLPMTTYQQALTSAAPVLLTQQALLDPALRTRLGPAVGAG